MKQAVCLVCVTIALTLTALTGCVRHNPHRTRSVPVPIAVHREGPPPHAPAHGYRHKHRHHGVELRFDALLGVYVVVGSSHVYFHRDQFYRVMDGSWQISAHLDRGWAHLHPGKLPKGLAGKTPHARGKGHGKSHPPAKQRH